MTITLFLLSTLFISSYNSASAAIWICFESNGIWTCFVGEGTCDGWCPDPPATPRCYAAAGISINPETAFISVVGGQAWVVNGKEVTPIASDSRMEFIKSVQKKYPVDKRKDPEVQKKIVQEFAEFQKRVDNGKVSNARVEALSKELGLRVYKFNPLPTITKR